MEEKGIENQIALFNLVSSLAYRLTGQIPTIKLRLGDSSFVMVIPTIDNITWVEGDSQYPCRHLQASAKHFQPDDAFGVS